MERFIRTLEEQLSWVDRFTTGANLPAALRALTPPDRTPARQPRAGRVERASARRSRGSPAVRVNPGESGGVVNHRADTSKSAGGPLREGRG